MRYLLAPILLLGVVFVYWQAKGPQPDTEADPLSVEETPDSPLPVTLMEIEAGPDGAGNLGSIQSRRPEVDAEIEDLEPEVINIGAPMDPDDPSTWPETNNTQVVNIGEPMDPDDPSTWPEANNTEVVNIGEPMDPNDPSTWPETETTVVVNIGEYMAPDEPATWPEPENREVVNIGEPMDHDDPETWP